MIGKLRGTVDSAGEDWVIVDVHGVGYLVSCSGQTLQALPGSGEAISLAIETYVREQEIKLFGFVSEAEREWFRLLLTVQGVGPRVALAILGTLKASDLASAIALQDKAMVARAPGVGPKVAQRICTELKGKGPVGLSDPVVAEFQEAAGEGALPSGVADAVSALVNLGYGQMEATTVIARIAGADDANRDTATLIRQGLKELSQ